MMNVIKILDGRCDHCQRRIFPGSPYLVAGKLSFHVPCFGVVETHVIRRAIMDDVQGVASVDTVD